MTTVTSSSRGRDLSSHHQVRGESSEDIWLFTPRPHPGLCHTNVSEFTVTSHRPAAAAVTAAAAAAAKIHVLNVLCFYLLCCVGCSNITLIDRQRNTRWMCCWCRCCCWYCCGCCMQWKPGRELSGEKWNQQFVCARLSFLQCNLKCWL